MCHLPCCAIFCHISGQQGSGAYWLTAQFFIAWRSCPAAHLLLLTLIRLLYILFLLLLLSEPYKYGVTIIMSYNQSFNYYISFIGQNNTAYVTREVEQNLARVKQPLTAPRSAQTFPKPPKRQRAALPIWDDYETAES